MDITLGHHTRLAPIDLCILILSPPQPTSFEMPAISNTLYVPFCNTSNVRCTPSELGSRAVHGGWVQQARAGNISLTQFSFPYSEPTRCRLQHLQTDRTSYEPGLLFDEFRFVWQAKEDMLLLQPGMKPSLCSSSSI